MSEVPASEGPASGSAGPLTIRPMRADDDMLAELDLRHRAFGPMDATEREYWLAEVRACIDDQRQFGVWAAGQLIGAARYYDMRQWWHGRSLPMGGVAGVKVAPEARGLGVGRALTRALLADMAGRGYALSALYPATAQIYRSLGWEIAGGHYRIEVPGRSLGKLMPADQAMPAPGTGAAGRPAIRRAGPQDADQVLRVLGAIHAGARDCGPSTFDVASVRRWLAGPDLFAYLADDGFLGYGWAGSGYHEIAVYYLQAASAATARALWGIVGSHASVTETVLASVGPDDPISWLTPEPDVRLRRHRPWMLRVLDADAAIAGRGFPAGLTADVPLLLADPELPANAGPRTLSVRGGTGSLRPGLTARAAGSATATPVRLGPRGLAALFAGTPMRTLRLAGLADGGEAGADEVLDGLFAGRPYLLDYF